MVSAWKRLVARIIGTAALGNGKYLGYCSTHNKYYIDHLHTNGTIYCPDGTKEFLKERMNE